MNELKKKRIGVHVGIAGGSWTAVERAVAAGANTFQIFTASPRMWKAAAVKAEDAAKMRELRAKFDVGPVAVHASYLINLCSRRRAFGRTRRGRFGARWSGRWRWGLSIWCCTRGVGRD